MSFWRCPLSYVRITLNAFPYSVALFDSLVPFTIVDLTIFPCIDTFTMSFSIFKLSEVCISIRISFKSLTVPQIIQPTALIYSHIWVDHNSLSMPDVFTLHLALIDGIFEFFDDEILRWLDVIIVEHWTNHGVIIRH